MKMDKLVVKGKEFLEKNPEIIKEVQRIAKENPEMANKVKNTVIDVLKNKK